MQRLLQTTIALSAEDEHSQPDNRKKRKIPFQGQGSNERPCVLTQSLQQGSMLHPNHQYRPQLQATVQHSDYQTPRSTLLATPQAKISTVTPASSKGCFHCGDEGHYVNRCPKKFPNQANTNTLKHTRPQARNGSQVIDQSNCGQQDTRTQSDPRDLDISDWVITYSEFQPNKAKRSKRCKNQVRSVQQDNPVSQAMDGTAGNASLPRPNILIPQLANLDENKPQDSTIKKVVCYLCGGEGHIVRYCPKTYPNRNQINPQP